MDAVRRYHRPNERNLHRTSDPAHDPTQRTNREPTLMRIAVVGAGGMGSAFAAYLSRAGADVVLIGRTAPHVDAISATGLLVEAPDGSSFTAHPRATWRPGTLAAASVDALVMLTKSFDTEQASSACRHVLREDGVAVSLQNGLGNDDALAREFGRHRSLPGVTTVGAKLHQPGRITVSPSTAAGTSLSHIGPPAIEDPGYALRRAADLAAVLSGADLPAVAKPDALLDIWGKLALAVMGPASAVLRRTVGDTWAQPEARLLIRDMFDEVVGVAHAEGVPIDVEAAWQHAVRTYEGTGRHMTSMCTDIVLHRRTEIEAMAGEVARRGDLHGVPVPVHHAVVRMVRTLQATYGVAL